MYIGGVALTAAPGVWRALVSMRTLLLLGGIAPLVSLAGLLSAVIMSSRVNDPRAAQQLGGLFILPLTVVFVIQLVNQSLVGVRPILGALALLAAANLVLLWIGVRVFQRETILMRWK
jgi:ABC-2 type transport system permease protein